MIMCNTIPTPSDIVFANIMPSKSLADDLKLNIIMNNIKLIIYGIIDFIRMEISS